MEIAVDGWRAGSADREVARALLPEQLPRLTHEQRSVARKLGIPEEEYARSLVAGQRSHEALLAKTERLARLLAKLLKEMNATVTVENITLRTFEEKFDVLLRSGTTAIPLRISEDIVDELFERGSEDAERRIARVLQTALLVVREQ